MTATFLALCSVYFSFKGTRMAKTASSEEETKLSFQYTLTAILLLLGALIART